MVLTLEVEDSKVKAFVKQLKAFDYVKVKTRPMSKKKQAILDSLERAAEEVKQHQKGEIELQDASEMLAELRAELR